MRIRAGVSVAVMASAVVCLASSTPPVADHKETPDDRYEPVFRAGQRTSEAGRWERNGFVSVQVNVDADGNNIVGDAANEPSIAVDPAHPNRMVIGWRQFDTVTSNFRQAGWAYTEDGGQTWTFQDVIERGVFRSDPVLDADADGNVYYNSLTADGLDFWCHVFKSVDGGRSWNEGTYAFGGDKQWQEIDRTFGPGRGNIYMYWTLAYSSCSGQFTRSYTGGTSFQECTRIRGNPHWGTLSVGVDGELYCSGDGISVVRSRNVMFVTEDPDWDLPRTVDLGGSVLFAGAPNPAGLLGQVWVATDHSTGSTRGNVYLLCSVDKPGYDPLDVMFARSTDRGVTWSGPVRVNDDAEFNGAYQWFGTMGVAPNGRIDAVWNDTRNHPGSVVSELYYAYSLDAGQTWSENVAVTPPFNPLVGWPRQNKMGDYFDIASDNRGASVAFAATLNGEQDVYHVRVGPPLRPADFDMDGDVDRHDYSVMADCLGGPDQSPDPLRANVIERDCLAIFDIGADGPDGDVDLADLAAFQQLYTGNRVVHVDAQVVGGLADGTSWANAYADLESALGNARSGDQIWVARGVYRPAVGVLDARMAAFHLVDGVAVYGGFAGDEFRLDQRDVIANETVLSGDIGAVDDPADNAYHVVMADGTGPGTRLDGFVITGGRADGREPNDRGAGVLARMGTLHMARCRIVNNVAAAGGGVMNIDGDVTVVNTSFTGNVADPWSGGAFHNHGGTSLLLNSSCYGNQAALTMGGGLRNYNGGTLRLRNTVLWGNAASGGTDESAQIGEDPSGTLDVSFCCVQGWTGAFGGEGNIGTNPLFVNPAGEDGQVGTADDDLRLSHSSSSIDAGDNGSVPAGVDIDLAGAPRIRDGDDDGEVVVDMGAFEFGP